MMFFARRVVKLIGLVTMITENLLRMSLERMSNCDISSSFDELDGHTKIITPFFF